MPITTEKWWEAFPLKAAATQQPQEEVPALQQDKWWEQFPLAWKKGDPARFTDFASADVRDRRTRYIESLPKPAPAKEPDLFERLSNPTVEEQRKFAAEQGTAPGPDPLGSKPFVPPTQEQMQARSAEEESYKFNQIAQGEAIKYADKPGKYKKRTAKEYEEYASSIAKQLGGESNPEFVKMVKPILDAYDLTNDLTAPEGKGITAENVPPELRPYTLLALQHKNKLRDERQKDSLGVRTATMAAGGLAQVGQSLRKLDPFQSREDWLFEKNALDVSLDPARFIHPDQGFISRNVQSALAALPKMGGAALAGGPAGVALMFGLPTAVEVEETAKERGASSLSALGAGVGAGTLETVLFSKLPGRVLGQLGGKSVVSKRIIDNINKYAFETLRTGGVLTASSIKSRLAEEGALWVSGKSGKSAGDLWKETVNEIPDTLMQAALLHLPSGVKNIGKSAMQKQSPGGIVFGPEGPVKPPRREISPAEEFAWSNPSGAKRLTAFDEPSRKVWEKEGLPKGTSGKQRRAFVESLRSLPEGQQPPTTQKTLTEPEALLGPKNIAPEANVGRGRDQVEIPGENSREPQNPRNFKVGDIVELADNGEFAQITKVTKGVKKGEVPGIRIKTATDEFVVEPSRVWNRSLAANPGRGAKVTPAPVEQPKPMPAEESRPVEPPPLPRTPEPRMDTATKPDATLPEPASRWPNIPENVRSSGIDELTALAQASGFRKNGAKLSRESVLDWLAKNVFKKPIPVQRFEKPTEQIPIQKNKIEFDDDSLLNLNMLDPGMKPYKIGPRMADGIERGWTDYEKWAKSFPSTAKMLGDRGPRLYKRIRNELKQSEVNPSEPEAVPEPLGGASPLTPPVAGTAKPEASNAGIGPAEAGAPVVKPERDVRQSLSDYRAMMGYPAEKISELRKGSKKHSRALIRDADVKYQELKAMDAKERRASSTAIGKEILSEERQKAKSDVENGIITPEAMKYRPTSELPAPVKDSIREGAQALLADTESPKVRAALEKIIKDAGSDVGAEVEKQKERIVEKFTGKRGGSTKNEEPWPIDPVINLFTMDPAKRNALIDKSMKSIADGEPDELAKRVQWHIENGEGSIPFSTPEEVVGVLRGLRDKSAPGLSVDIFGEPITEAEKIARPEKKSKEMFEAGLPGQTDIFGGVLSKEQAIADAAEVRAREAAQAPAVQSEAPTPSNKGDFDQGKLFQVKDQGELFGLPEAEKAIKEAAESKPDVESFGFFGGGKSKGERVRSDIVGDLKAKKPEEVQQRMKKAHGIKRVSLVAKVNDLFWSGFHKMTRAREHLPNNAKFSVANEHLRLLQDDPKIAQEKSLEVINAIVDPLGPKQFELFEESLVVSNQLSALEAGQPLRHGWKSKKDVAAYKKEVDALVEKTPEVKKALETRTKVIRELVEKQVEHGLLSKECLNNVDNYFHQQVLMYQEAYQRAVRGGKVKPIRRSYQKKRVSGIEELGEEYDYNTSYLEAETSWMSDARYELAKKIRRDSIEAEYDMMPKLKKQAKDANWIELVGGQKNANRIEELRGLIRESWEGENRSESSERMARKGWIEELQKLDPTYSYRSRIAQLAEKLREKLGIRADDEYVDEYEGEGWWSKVKEEADKNDPLALGFLKAINERREFIKSELGDKYQTWEDIARGDKSAEVYQWKPGSVLYPATTIPERIAEQLQKGIIEEAKLSKEDLRHVMALGGPQKQMVLPTELVSQLDSMEKPKPSGAWGSLSDEMMSAWKVWTILNPKRALPYMIRNTTGDVDPVVAAAPGALKPQYQGPAHKELYNYYIGKKLPITKALKAARDLGVFSSSLTAHEIPDISELDLFRRFSKSKTAIYNRPAKAVRDYFSTVKKYNEFRESTQRYASFLYYRDQLLKGTLKHYGTSRKSVVDALKKKMGVDVAAAHLSRNLLGDYGNRTVFGNWMRRRVAPFFAWQEINIQRYPSLVVNAVKAGQYKRAGISAGVASAALSVRVGAMYAALWTANNLLFSDDEEKLSTYDRANPHLTLGSNPDGSVVNFRNVGSLGDFLEWFGLNDATPLLKKYADGQIELTDVFKEMAKSPVNKLIGSIRPDVKALYEVPAGQSSFPDVLNPRTAGRGDVVSGIFGLQDEYKWVKGMIIGEGGRPRPHYWQRWLLGVSDPRANALNEIYDLRESFLKRKGVDLGGTYPISKYKNARESAQNQDYDAFKEWRRSYMKKEGEQSYEKFADYLGRMDPIQSGLKTKDEIEFETKYLSAIQRQKLKVARDYSHQLADTLWMWWITASQEEGSQQEKDQLRKSVFKQAKTAYGHLTGKPPSQQSGESTEDYEARKHDWKRMVGKSRVDLPKYKKTVESL